VSLRRFADGWEPAEVTEYEYDDAGRLVRSVTRREPEWDEEQRAWMLALDECERLSCDGCGGWLPDTLRRGPGEYVVPAPSHCAACAATAITAQDYHRDYPVYGHLMRYQPLWRADVEPHGVGGAAGEGGRLHLGDSLG
jgi:hypothetical protein